MEDQAPYKRRFSVAARKRSFHYAWKGMKRVFKVEHNMWIHLCAAAAVVFAGFCFHIGNMQWVMLTLAIGMVITAELFNSAIEELVNLVSPDYHEKAGLVKDIAAGAVLIAAIAAAVIGLLVFVPELMHL